MQSPNIITASRLETPVSLIFFRRANTLQAVMERLREVKPRRLFLIADGPREGVDGEAERCQEARDTALSLVDWPCELHQNFAESNMGCGPRPSSGISWTLERVDRTIILEDDCVPDPSFFGFCEELLERYKDDERIAHINGSTFLPGKLLEPNASYGFSRYTMCWGWATWRRAWKRFDYTMSAYPQFRDSGQLERMFPNEEESGYWRRRMDAAHGGDNSVWAVRWMFAAWHHKQLSIVPTKNMVTNVGFGVESTHTGKKDVGGNQPLEAMPFPMVHPSKVERSVEHDAELETLLFPKPGRWERNKNAIKRFVPNSLWQWARRMRNKRHGNAG